MGFPGGLVGKEFACNAGNLGSIPGLGRSPGEGKGYSLQYSGLENSMDCIVHGVAKSQKRLSDCHFTSYFSHFIFPSVSEFTVVVIQLLSCVQLFATLSTSAFQASLSFTISQSLLKLMSIELMMPSSHLILCRPLLLQPPIPPSISLFQ